MKLSKLHPLSVFLVSLFLCSCVLISENVQKDVQDTAEEKAAENPAEKKSLDADFSSTENVLMHNGWKVSAPKDCRFHCPVAVNPENEVLRVTFNSESLLSLHKLDLDFSVNSESFKQYIEKEISSEHKITEKGSYPKSHTKSERYPGDYWIFSGKTVFIEPADEDFYEWRINCQLTGPDVKSRVSDRIVHEAEIIDRSISGRITKNGFSFISNGSLWRWRTDFADGFIVERMVKNNEPAVIAAFFSPDKLKGSEKWIKQEAENGSKTRRSFVIAGETFNADVTEGKVTDNFGRTEYFRYIIHLPPGPLRRDVCIVFYYEILSDKETDVSEIMNMDQIQSLLKYSVSLPLEAEL